MNRIPCHVLPLVLMGAALALFVAFHFLLVTKSHDDMGWKIWVEVVDMLRNPGWMDAMSGVGIASLLMFSMLIVSSPFLIGVWLKSKLAWSLATGFSGLGAAGFWFMVLMENTAGELVLGGWCLMLAPVLNFMGLLLLAIRRQKQGPA